MLTRDGKRSRESETVHWRLASRPVPFVTFVLLARVLCILMRPAKVNRSGYLATEKVSGAVRKSEYHEEPYYREKELNQGIL